MRENRTHGSEGGDGESRFRPLSKLLEKWEHLIRSKLRESSPQSLNKVSVKQPQEKLAEILHIPYLPHAGLKTEKQKPSTIGFVRGRKLWQSLLLRLRILSVNSR